jgi:hypothetical protein
MQVKTFPLRKARMLCYKVRVVRIGLDFGWYFI